MECRQTLFTDFLTSKSSLSLGCVTRSVRQWSVALLLTGSFLSVPAVFGQGFNQGFNQGIYQGSTPPTYTPKVSEAYFFGNSNDVYPDPYQSQQQDYVHFEPAPGVSNPVSDQEVRARNRSERRERLRKLIPGSGNSATSPNDVTNRDHYDSVESRAYGQAYEHTHNQAYDHTYGPDGFNSDSMRSGHFYGHAYGSAYGPINTRTREPSPVHWEITYPENAPAPNGQRSSRPVMQALRGTTPTERQNLERENLMQENRENGEYNRKNAVNQDAQYADSRYSDSSWKTPAPTLWNSDGTTSALPTPGNTPNVTQVNTPESMFNTQ
ncbi:MAG: hypothetical protein Q4C70_09390, partial [Planctomycetia bacterium]|nr:hypothetical protein [Planctomycetia bacterium]